MQCNDGDLLRQLDASSWWGLFRWTVHDGVVAPSVQPVAFIHSFFLSLTHSSVLFPSGVRV